MSDASIYVGTYAKYNNGNLSGAWVELVDEDSFWDEIRELHKDEADPEFMFQDFEGFPKAFYSESGLDKRLWDWLELDERMQEVTWDYLEDCDASIELDDIKDRYQGSFRDKEHWAEDYWDQCGMLNDLPESLRPYIDYEAYARDAQCGGDVSFVDARGGGIHVFSNY